MCVGPCACSGSSARTFFPHAVRTRVRLPVCLQWQQLDQAADLLGSAPDDEVLAEILALQSELVQQVRDSCAVPVPMSALPLRWPGLLRKLKLSEARALLALCPQGKVSASRCRPTPAMHFINMHA